MNLVGLGTLIRNERNEPTWFEPGANDHRAITTESRLDEILGESLRLRLRTNKEGNAKDNAAQAQK